MKLNESMILDKLKSIMANVQDLEAAEQKSMNLASQLRALANDIDSEKNGAPAPINPDAAPIDGAAPGEELNVDTDSMFNDVQFDFDKNGKMVSLPKDDEADESDDEQNIEDRDKKKVKKVKEDADSVFGTLKIGDTVKYKISSQTGTAKVIAIELTKENEKYGQDVQEIEWNLVVDGKATVDLDNGKWAYGYQIRPVNVEFNEEAGAGASPGIAQGGMASAPNMTNGIYGLWSNYSGKRKSKKFKTPMAVRKFLEDNEDWHNKLDEEDN